MVDVGATWYMKILKWNTNQTNNVLHDYIFTQINIKISCHFLLYDYIQYAELYSIAQQNNGWKEEGM